MPADRGEHVNMKAAVLHEVNQPLQIEEWRIDRIVEKVAKEESVPVGD